MNDQKGSAVFIIKKSATYALDRQPPHVHVIRGDGPLGVVVERGVESVEASGEVNLEASARRGGIDFLLEILAADG